MKRIDTATKAVDLFGAGKHGYKDGNKGLGIPATDLNASTLNALQEEIANVIESEGIALNPADNTQLLQVINRLIRKPSDKIVRVASTAAINLAAPGANIDGVAMVAGDTFLEKDNATQASRGIYVWNGAAVPATRDTGADAGDELFGGIIIRVKEGTVNGDTNWQVSNDGAVTIGVTGLTFKVVGAEASPVKPGEIIDFAGFVAPSGYLACPLAQTNISRVTYAALWDAIHKESAVTISIATPGVITWNAHPLVNGLPVVLSTTGALPTGLVAGTTYYVVGATTNTFNLSATVGGAAINTTGAQNGVHTAVCAPWGVGDGATTFGMPWFPADYATVQANANVGTNHVGVNLAHTHTVLSGAQNNAGGSAGGSDVGTAVTATTSSSGGPANLAAGARVLKCVKY